MTNKLTRHQQLLLDQVLLQSIAESIRDAIKPQLRPILNVAPLMEINVEVDSIKIDNNYVNDANNNNNNENTITIRNIGEPMSLEDDFFGTCFYNSDDDTNVWDPLNISEEDSIKIDDNDVNDENTNDNEEKNNSVSSCSLSSDDSVELNIQTREEENSSPELGVPHPRILRRLKIGLNSDFSK